MKKIDMSFSLIQPSRMTIIVFLCTFLICLLGLESCKKDNDDKDSQGFIPFDQFISGIHSAKPDDYVGKPGSQVENAAAFEEMRQHILKMYEGITPAHSFVENRQMVDCVPIDQQPGLRRPGGGREEMRRESPVVTYEPQPQKTGGVEGSGKAADLTLKPGVKDPHGEEMYCAEGTIPMRRLTLEEMTRFKDLRSFFSKASQLDNFDPHQRPGGGDIPPADATHYYARGVQFVDNFGADSWLDLWNPTVSSNQFSLSQQWIVGGDGTSKQTAESGWQVYPKKYGNNNANLFIFYTTAGYKDGCYNLDCSGFVQRANNIYLGRGFDHTSSTGGDQWGFNLQWKRNTDGNWWLFYRGPGSYIAVGYYPHSLYGTGTLASKATKIAFGGEDTGQPSALQMGSGQQASAGWQKAAYQNRVFYINTQTVSQWASLNKEETAGCYTADIHNIFGTWGTYEFFGGGSCH